MGMEEHRKYGRWARKAYRVLIVVCAVAVMVAVLIWYLNAD